MTAGNGREHRGAPETDCAPPEVKAEDARLFEEVTAALAAFRDEVREYVEIKLAKWKLALVQKSFTIAFAIGGAVVAMVFLAAAVVFFLSGLAGWIAAASDVPWLGSLVVGGAIILLVVVAFFVVKSRMTRKAARTASGRDP